MSEQVIQQKLEWLNNGGTDSLHNNHRRRRRSSIEFAARRFFCSAANKSSVLVQLQPSSELSSELANFAAGNIEWQPDAYLCSRCKIMRQFNYLIICCTALVAARLPFNGHYYCCCSSSSSSHKGMPLIGPALVN